MGYTVFLERSNLRFKTKRDGDAVVSLIRRHEMDSYFHFGPEPLVYEFDGAWTFDPDFEGDHWQPGRADRLWLALAPHVMPGSTLEFRGEEDERWRVRWAGNGRVVEEIPLTTWLRSRKL